MPNFGNLVAYPLSQGFEDQTSIAYRPLTSIDFLTGLGGMYVFADAVLTGEYSILTASVLASSMILGRTAVSYLVGRVFGFGLQVIHGDK